MKIINKSENDRRWFLTVIRASSNKQEAARNCGFTLRTFDNWIERHQINWRKELRKDLFPIETNFFKSIQFNLSNLFKNCKGKKYIFFGFCLIITIHSRLINKNNEINLDNTLFSYSIERPNRKLFRNLEHKNKIFPEEKKINANHKM
jgi:hypothetical protein